jgi:protocatechuate 3,4-dioxygenase beta subunit
LRGYQITDNEGKAHFTTIYPGWYQGRTVHIHFKVRTKPGAFLGEEFTSQLYFDDAVTDVVQANPPYSSKGRRRMRNSDDGVFRNGGSRLILNTVKIAQGYSSVFDVGMQL